MGHDACFSANFQTKIKNKDRGLNCHLTVGNYYIENLYRELYSTKPCIVSSTQPTLATNIMHMFSTHAFSLLAQANVIYSANAYPCSIIEYYQVLNNVQSQKTVHLYI